jgi:hypothetical protein
MLAAIWFRIFLFPVSIKDLNIKIIPKYNFVIVLRIFGYHTKRRTGGKFGIPEILCPLGPRFLTKGHKCHWKNIFFLTSSIAYVVARMFTSIIN